MTTLFTVPQGPGGGGGFHPRPPALIGVICKVLDTGHFRIMLLDRIISMNAILLQTNINPAQKNQLTFSCLPDNNVSILFF